MCTKLFTLTLLSLLALLPHSGSAQRLHHSRAEHFPARLSAYKLPGRGSAQRLHHSRAGQKKLNDTFLREGPSASPTRIRELLAQGAELDCTDQEGATVLMKAGAQIGLTEALEFEDFPRARAALTEGDPISVRDIFGRNPLMLAAEKGRADIVQTLLERGADPNVQDYHGSTALMFAVQGQPTSMAPGRTLWSGTRDRESRTKIVAMLLDHHADPNLNPYFYHGRYFRNPATDAIEETALSYAQDVNNLTVVDLLIRHGAKPHAPMAPVKSTR